MRHKDQWDLQRIANYVECEGLAYAVGYGLAPEKIADHELARLWSEAREALERVERKLPAPQLEEDEACQCDDQECEQK